MTDPHFIVWMRPSAFPNFKKLWGRVELSDTNEKLLKGLYQVEFDVNWKPPAGI